MIRLLALLLLFVTGSAPRTQELAMPEIPSLTVTVEPAAALDGGSYVHGQLVLTVRLVSRHAFEELDLQLAEIVDAEVVQLVRPRTRYVRSYAGDGHVFEVALAVFPNRSGMLVLPGPSVRGTVETADGELRRFADNSPDLEIEVLGIDPGFEDPWWLVSERVDIAETWSKPSDELRVGDVVRREVTVTAFGVTANRMPTIEHGRTQGIVVADAGRTTKTDVTATGVVTSVRRAWDLQVQTDGVAHISPVGVAYWDPSQRIEVKVATPARRIEPLPADRVALAEALLAEARDRHARQGWLAAGLLGMAIGLFLLLGAVALIHAIPTGADRRLARASARARSLGELYALVRRWEAASRLNLAGPEAPAAYQALVRSLFAERAAPVDRRRLVRDLVRHARRQRIERLWAWFARITAAVLGPRRDLELPAWGAGATRRRGGRSTGEGNLGS